MARIELRNAIIRIMDGYSATGTVDNVAGYAIGATTMTIADTPGTAIPLLASFQVTPDHGAVYIVTAASGGPPTTSITFTPGLEAAVDNNDVIVFGGRALEINVGDGNLTYNETKEYNYDLDRGQLDTVREGDQQPMEVNLEFIWEFITAVSGSGTPTIEDALKQRGEASDWESSSADACEPYAVDIRVEYTPPCGGEQREFILLPDFRYESLDHNAQDAQISVTGRCNAVEATVSRVANP